MYKHVDYYKTYGRIMQFNKNKKEPIHRWYPFVEGYSREFIESILKEMKKKELVCLEPFSGSGTTALELQNNNIPCYAFEVNPLMYLIARVKLENNYDVNRIIFWHDYIKNSDEDIYKDLFTVALASILLEVSNLYRNGKCLSYKKNWKERSISQDDVFRRFDEKIQEQIISDIRDSMNRKTTQNNKQHLYNMDSRVGIENEVQDNTIDLVITSPPYLNSRDYTDTYMLELKTLGFTDSAAEIRKLREKTLRSHVQIKWEDDTQINNVLLTETLRKLESASENIEQWNDSIIDMVRLYFVDMKKIFCVLYKKMKQNGRVYFNVSNSAYFNVLIDTLEICASIAEQEGFKVIEIRDARKLKTSPQQQEKVGKLLEGVIVLER